MMVDSCRGKPTRAGGVFSGRHVCYNNISRRAFGHAREAKGGRMNGRKVVPLALTFLGAVGALLCSFGLWQAAAALTASAPYLDAPLFSDGDDPADFNGRLVWARGSLVPAAADAFLVSPYAEVTCLGYVSEKLRGGWDTDSDGDRYRTWTVEEHVRRAVPMDLRVGGVFLKVDANGARFLNEVKVVDRERTVDGADYRFTERIMPVINTIWAIGRLRGTTFTASDRGLFVSLDAPEPATRLILGESALFLYFAAFLGMAGLGCLAGFASLLLRGRRVFPRPSTTSSV